MWDEFGLNPGRPTLRAENSPQWGPLKESIYEKLKEGQSKSEIKEFLVKRYGEFILFKPLFNISNFLLWLAPIFSFAIVAFLGFRKTIIKKKND